MKVEQVYLVSYKIRFLNVFVERCRIWYRQPVAANGGGTAPAYLNNISLGHTLNFFPNENFPTKSSNFGTSTNIGKKMFFWNGKIDDIFRQLLFVKKKKKSSNIR